MDRYIKSGGSASPPTPDAGATNNYPQPGDPVAPTPASVPGPFWFHMITEELRAVLTAAGLTPDHTDTTQLNAAIAALIEARVGDFSLATGPADAYVAALNPVLAAYSGNFTGRLKIPVANTGPCTVDFGPSAVPLVADDGSALAAGDLPVGVVVSYEYVHADGKAYITSLMPSQLAVGKSAGDIFLHAGTTAPAGSLIVPLVATNLSRTTYADLFAAIGTTWGVGDGSTTFGMPFLAADETIVQANANVGSHTAGSVISHAHLLPSGAGGGAAYYATYTSAPAAFGVLSQASGGSANLAAGNRFLLCVQY